MVRLMITENEADQRLDRFLRKYFRRASLSFIYKMIRKDIKLNGRRVREDTILSIGDQLTVYMPEKKFRELTAGKKKSTVKKQFKVVYEDEDILIVDKPRGLLIHGDSREKKNTLANQVCGYLQEQGSYDPTGEKTFTPSPVNRLDRNTTGLVIFGKTAAALRSFTRLIRQRDGVEKYYLAIICGRLETALVLDDRMKKDERRNVSELADSSEGKEAVTYIRPIECGDQFSLVEARILTGRTHQIRFHLANAGFPIAGDSKYGDIRINGRLKKHGITTQLLHACRLKFDDSPDIPENLRGKVMEAPAPADFIRAEHLLIHGKD